MAKKTTTVAKSATKDTVEKQTEETFGNPPQRHW